MDTYNSEIDMVNAVSEQVQADLADVEQDKTKAAAQLWSEYSEYLSPSTAEVVKTLSSAMIKK